MLKYLVKRSKRKTIAIEIHANGEIWVRAPQRASRNLIEAFLTEKSVWIEKKLAQIQAHPIVANSTHQFVSGETFLYLGNPYPLQVVPSQRRELTFSETTPGAFLLAAHAQSHAQILFTRWYQQRAREFFTQRIDFYSQATGLSPTKLRFSAARTRWGSCSSRGFISLVWRLVMAPPEIIDYVIVHELVHLRVHNHSKDFWQALAAILPNYSLHRKWLKDHGHTLDLT